MMLGRLIARRAMNVALCLTIAANAVALAMVLAACGGGTASDDGYGGRNPPPADEAEWTQSIRPLVSANCGGCHDGLKEPAFTSGAVFRASAAKAKIESGAMPKGKTLDPQTKAAMLAYLK